MDMFNCSTIQYSTTQYSTAQHSTAQHSTAQHSTAQHSTAQHSTAQHKEFVKWLPRIKRQHSLYKKMSFETFSNFSSG
jgi:hypothetical protein